jgi:hypothetical protein
MLPSFNGKLKLKKTCSLALDATAANRRQAWSVHLVLSMQRAFAELELKEVAVIGAFFTCTAAFAWALWKICSKAWPVFWTGMNLSAIRKFMRIVQRLLDCDIKWPAFPSLRP